MSAPQPAADDLTPVQRHALHRAIEGLREDDPLRSASVAMAAASSRDLPAARLDAQTSHGSLGSGS